jgi:hypothetical protein
LAYNRFDRVPKPTTQAVMFCLMDASASMTEPLKDLAKRFFMLLHVFLTRYYREVHIVFIRHTSTAAEVDEETFFRGTETGGTVISTALDEMLKVVRERYSPARLEHLRGAASDGDNFHDDMPRCLELLDDEIPAGLPVFSPTSRLAQASASTSGGDTGLARLLEVARRRRNFAMRRGGASAGWIIFPVFHELFSADNAAALMEAIPVGHHCEPEAPPNAKGTCVPCSTGRSGPFELIQKVHDTMGEHRAKGEARPSTIYPNQIEVHHRRADARLLFLDRHAADVPALVVRQALCARRGVLQARHAQPGLRARHQFRPLHQLRHGGELHDHAGAGDRPRSLRP